VSSEARDSAITHSSRVGGIVAGKYRLERLLGVGGMGAVYEAVHIGVERRFAVKIMKREAADAPDSAHRFMQEAKAAAFIRHPNIVDVFDVGATDDGSLYMVMELLSGRSLHAALNDGPLTIELAATIACEMLRALASAHKAGIVHRDIKPANVFLLETNDGGIGVKLLDFGVAKFAQEGTPAVTQSGAIVGSPLYMAPEQVMAERDVDGRADVWAVGATLFEMLTGRPVHPAPSASAAAVRIVTESAPSVRSLRADVDPALDALVARALTIARAGRFASAEEMLAALETHGSSLAPTLVSSGTKSRALPTPRKKRPLALIAAASFALGLGSVAILLALREQKRTPIDVDRTPSASTEVPRAATPTPIPTPSVPSTATSTATASASASPIVTARPPPKPSCERGEVLSNGHCCAIGLVWQQGRCDRPLATQTPF
jgi:serine/threonine-protein kinase